MAQSNNSGSNYSVGVSSTVNNNQNAYNKYDTNTNTNSNNINNTNNINNNTNNKNNNTNNINNNTNNMNMNKQYPQNYQSNSKSAPMNNLTMSPIQ